MVRVDAMRQENGECVRGQTGEEVLMEVLR
jgi:hypothetical protein